MADKISEDTKQLVKILKEKGLVKDDDTETVMEAILENVSNKDELIKLYSK